MLKIGCSLDDIEAWIERLPLDEENKAALWLYAWMRRSGNGLFSVAEAPAVESHALA